MTANMCVESHARNTIENGFDLIIVADVTASAGEEALKGRSHQL
jgi:nicotinamidase-related amidase